LGNQGNTAGLNDTGDSGYDTKYPKLAKKASDGTYCYLVQRRLSAYITGFCVRRGISANAATRIDFILALLAALFLYLGYSITAVVFIQLFGIWSCVDGEIARLTKSTSRLGDFYDTMVDRTAEFLIVGALMLSMHKAWPDVSWGAIFLLIWVQYFLLRHHRKSFVPYSMKIIQKTELNRFSAGFAPAATPDCFIFLSVLLPMP